MKNKLTCILVFINKNNYHLVVEDVLNYSIYQTNLKQTDTCQSEHVFAYYGNQQKNQNQDKIIPLPLVKLFRKTIDVTCNIFQCLFQIQFIVCLMAVTNFYRALLILHLPLFTLMKIMHFSSTHLCKNNKPIQQGSKNVIFMELLWYMQNSCSNAQVK